jgi:hypothetical protein
MFGRAVLLLLFCPIYTWIVLLYSVYSAGKSLYKTSFFYSYGNVSVCSLNTAKVALDKVAYSKVCTVAARKKVGAARCEYVFDIHTSKAGKRLKVVLFHLWRISVETTGGFINIPVEDFHMVKTAP